VRLRRLAPPLALAAAAVLGARPAGAFAIVAALSSDSEHYRLAYEGFAAEWGAPVPVVPAGGRLPEAEPGAVVAFGSRAALSDWPEGPILVDCLAPGARPSRRGEVLRVELLPEPALLAKRLKQLMPRLKVLRVLWSSDYEDAEVGELADAAAVEGVKVVSERVPSPSRLPERLRALSGPADALWLMPDPALVNAENFATLREYAAAARVPFLAPAEGLAEKGATATLAAPFRDVGRAAAVALRARLRGERILKPAHPDRVIVTVNAAAARATGLDLSAASGVDRTIP
jgi:hypothetical protein